MAQVEIRSHDWFDSIHLRREFGVQVKVGRNWAHVVAGGRPLLFQTSAARDEYIDILKARLTQKEGG